MKKVAVFWMVAILAMAARVEGLYMADPIPLESDLKPLAKELEWPEGVVAVMEDKSRVAIWHPFFSELPNDAYFTGYVTTTAEEVNRLIAVLAQVKGSGVRVLLRPGSGELLPSGKREANAVLVVGSQKVLNEWFKGLPEGRFGVTVYKEAPKAAVPTLIVYAGSGGGGKLDLKEMVVPAGVVVEAEVSAEEEKKEELKGTVEKIRAFMSARGK